VLRLAAFGLGLAAGLAAAQTLPTVTLTAPDPLATERPFSTGTFRLTRTGTLSAPLTVRLTRAGTATAGSDYVSSPLSHTIPAGASSADIAVTPLNDSLAEAPETVVLTLTPRSAYVVGSPRTATVTLLSDEKPTVTLTAPTPTATEAGPSAGVFRITRTGQLNGSLTVRLTRTGTATAGSDYVNFPLTLTIPAGASRKDLLVTPLNDSLAEARETVVLTLAADAAYTVGNPSTATVTITSEDLPPVTLLTPSGVISTVFPTYTWQAVATAADYYLTVEDSTGPRLQLWYPAAQVGCPSGTGTCSVTPSVALEVGAARWWVKARNESGEGPLSLPGDFTVAALFAPILLAPAGIISATAPTYTWLPVASATDYYLWVEDSRGTRMQQWYSAAQAGCATSELCQVTPAAPLVAGAAKWRVKARDTSGEGPLSKQGTFTVDPLLASRQWSAWTKGTEPVFIGVYGAGDPSVLRDGALYRMSYTCWDPETSRCALCMAESPDGYTWQNIPGADPVEGLILRGRLGAWDEHLETSHLTKVGDQYRLFYSGYRDQGTPIQGFPGLLGLALSPDGRSFSRVSAAPILQPTLGWHDNDAILSPTVLFVGGTYYMLYTGHCYTNCTEEPGVRLLGATSPDGITWTKVAEPVLTRSTEILWMKDGAAESDLIQGPDGAYYLFFTGLQDDQRVIGVARGTSPFGPWQVNPVPIVHPTPGGFDKAGALSPEVIVEQGKARMWYLAFLVDGYPWIGYAEAVWPLVVHEP
jgi:hypothetical protein